MKPFINVADNMDARTVTWSGLFFLTQENVNKVPQKPGVYRLSYKETTEFYVFYVDECTNLRQLINKHLTESDNPCIALTIANKKYTCAFRFAEIEEDNVRKSALYQLFKHYQPRCNDKVSEPKDEIIINLQ
jgi:excinuclease UvrABC nuclease subunit